MTPVQSKILRALKGVESMTYQDLIFRTKLSYGGTYKALLTMCELGRVNKELIDGRAYFSLAPQVEEPFETTVQRAIRVRPVLHNIFWQGAAQ